MQLEVIITRQTNPIIALIYHDRNAVKNSASFIAENFAGTAPIVNVDFGKAVAVGVARTALHACFR